MIEIYNEQVRDLLNKESMKVKGGLKVRQSPTLGFYGNTLSPAIKNRKIPHILLEIWLELTGCMCYITNKLN